MNYLDCSKALFYSSQVRSVFLLRLGQTYRRVTGPSMLILSMDEALEIEDTENGGVHTTHSLLIPAGVGFDFKTNRARVAMVFLNDDGTDFRYLVPQMQLAVRTLADQVFFSGIKFENEIVAHAKEVWEKQPPASFTIRKLNDWVEVFKQLAESSGETIIVDERVEKALELIKATCTQNISVKLIAQQVGLSVPRLTQLFRETTGTSIRSYRLWLRVFYAARSLQQGLSLTEAAIKAGFTDYAQCFRVYKDLGGYHPSRTKSMTEVKVAA